ncbi:MAG: ATP-binding protein [Candidatus Micrarchaeales archaeon]|jgi:PAS domain S-box-containing protein
MQETLSVDKLIAYIFNIGRETNSADELFQKFGTMLKDSLSLDHVEIRDAYSEKSDFSGLEEFVINTNKPYIDNRLSGYSAFPELIRNYTLGFRSCMLLPVAVEGKPVFVSTLLSKQEDKFDAGLASTIGLALDMLAYQAVAKIEKERSISLARYFDAAFNTQMPQMLIDKSGTIVKANKSISIILSKNQREIHGRKISDFFSIDANMLDSLRNGLNAEVKDVSGMNRVYRVSCSKISDRLMHTLLYDVTEMKELEEKVRISEHGANDAFLLLSGDTTVLWASSNIGKIMKMDKENITGKRLIDLAYTDKDFANQIGSIADTLSRPLTINIGNGIFIEMKVTLVRNQFGGLSCVVSSNNAEKYITAIQEALDRFLTTTSDAIINVDSLGYIKSVNKSTEKLLGYGGNELIGSALSSIYADQESVQKFSSSLSIANSEGTVGNVFVNMRARGEGNVVPCEQTIKSVTDVYNNLTGYTVVVKELATKMKMEELEDEVEDLGKRLTNAQAESELKTDFIYNISHDLKTPLTNIKGFGKLLLESSGELSDEQKDYIKIITNESDRLFQLIQQILDVAKLSSKKIKLDLQPVNFNELAKNPTIGTLVEVAQNKGLEFGWNVDYNVPVIEADPNRLIQVFVNLIGNAIKFTEKGNINVKVSRTRKKVRIEVIDTGIGISKEDRSKLFKKFYQLQRRGLTVQEGSGTGLGLAIAKEIVSLHGGKISVTSEAGKGSTFFFILPISRTKRAASAKQQKSEES